MVVGVGGSGGMMEEVWCVEMAGNYGYGAANGNNVAIDKP